MSNTSIVLSNLDFDTIKNTFKQYLMSQDRFNDYDFEGSNMNVLLDLLSHNTFHNAFYLNMVGNEMFLDSAQLRDSVVSHAKELNYTPRSFKSAEANVNITMTSTDPLMRSVVIPKGTTFTSRFNTKNYTFSTAENIVVDNFVLNNGLPTFTGSNITLYEGYYVSDVFTYTANRAQRFVITNKNIDTSSLAITVVEDNGASTLHYSRATSLFDINSTSKVFFVQGAENDSYEIVFGDGVSGRRPKDNSVIIVEYRISNGELPNGCNSFIADNGVAGISTIVVVTNTSASGGAVSESIEDIKYNATRHFTTQERAITTEDYETLLKQNFPEVNTVTAYGGEDLDPPQFGKVFVAVDLKEVDGLPTIKKDQYYKFLKPRSPVSIDPVFVDPEYTYLNILSSIKYNINTTNLTSDDMKTIVSGAIINYAQQNLNSFNRVFRYSKLVQAIDNAQISIISNETNIRIVKIIRPALNVSQRFDVNYNTPLDVSRFDTTGNYTIQSTRFSYRGQRVTLSDDGQGALIVVSQASGRVVAEVGAINYESGLLQFSNFNISGFSGNGIKIYAVPRNKDIATINNVILNIIEEDVSLTIVPVRA